MDTPCKGWAEYFSPTPMTKHVTFQRSPTPPLHSLVFPKSGKPSLKVGLGIWVFCAISRRLISKIRFPHTISVADAICGTRFDLRDSKRRALEN